uniref:ARAD1D40480p n=1 Tax=Blastobotrys adeninivorans TaxID=409370 RepID=A0A060TCQ3_BLAAD
MSDQVQPLHQQPSQQGPSLSRQLLRNKAFMGQNFASPTDSIMSPCSAKLQAQKSKHLQRKPMRSFQEALRQSSQSEN